MSNNCFYCQKNEALDELMTERSTLGATINRLDYTCSNLNTMLENITAAESRISDVDMAEEMTEYTQQNVILQAATSMISQANERPQSVLQLLQ